MELSSESSDGSDDSKKTKPRVRLESVLEVSPIMLLVYSRDHRIAYISPAAARTLDVEQEEAIGKTWRELGWSAEMNERLAKEMESVFVSGTTLKSEAGMPTKRGWWEVNYDISPIKVKKGYVKMVAVSIADATKQRKTEEALAESEERFRSMAEQSSDGVLLSDENGVVIEWNNAMERITGMRREEALGKFIYDLQAMISEDASPETLDRVKTKTLTALQSGMAPFFDRMSETAIRRKSDGTKIWVQQNAFPIKTGKGFRIGSFTRDISQRRRREELDRALDTINTELVSTLDIDKAINAAVSAARNAIGCDSVVVSIKEGDKWTLRYGSGIPPESIGTEVQVTQDTAYSFTMSGRAIVIDDTEFDNRIDSSVVKRFGVKSQMSLPIRMTGKTVGALGFVHTTRTHTYSEQEIDFAVRLAVSLSLATENMRLFESEREQRALLQAIIDNAPVNILLVDGQTFRIKIWNETFRKSIEGVGDQRHYEEMTIMDIFPSLKDSAINTFRRVVENKGPYKIDEVQFDGLPQGRTHWNNLAVPIASKTGIPDIMIVSVDVTDQVNNRRRVEELAAKAEAERARLHAILSTIPAGVMICDPEGRLLESNDHLGRIFSGAIPRIESQNGYRVFKAWWADSGVPLRAGDWGILRAAKSGEVVIGDVLDIEKFDGSRGTILSSAAPIQDKTGRRLGAVAVIQDITQQRRLEHDAIDAKEHAELYLDLLTHDIRNLNCAASGYLHALSEKGELETASESLVIKSMEALRSGTRLIENVRKMQRIEFHEVKQGAINLSSTIQGVVEEHQGALGRQITINFKPSPSQIVIANEMLSDVFSNIIDNSIKYSKDPVVIDISVWKTYEHGRESYKITIEDNGQGIPDDMKGKLFSRIVRSKTKNEGSGFGLYLVRCLVEDFHGRVWVEDRVPGDHTKGARFVVMLPVAPH